MVSRKHSWCGLWSCHHLLSCLLRSVHVWPVRQYFVHFRVHATTRQLVNIMFVLFPLAHSQLALQYHFAWASWYLPSVSVPNGTHTPSTCSSLCPTRCCLQGTPFLHPFVCPLGSMKYTPALPLVELVAPTAVFSPHLIFSSYTILEFSR